MKKVKPVLIPMLWFDEEIRINRDISDQLGQVARVIQLNIIIPAVKKLNK